MTTDIRALRAARGWSVEELARRAAGGVSRLPEPTIAKWIARVERGDGIRNAGIAAGVAAGLSAALGVEVVLPVPAPPPDLEEGAETLYDVAVPYATLSAARSVADAWPELGPEGARRELTHRACMARRMDDGDYVGGRWRARYRVEGRRYDLEMIVEEDGDLAVIVSARVRSRAMPAR